MRVTSRGEELGTVTNTEARDEGSFELFMCRGYEASLDVVDGGVGREGEELGHIGVGEEVTESGETVHCEVHERWPRAWGMGGRGRRESVGRREGGGQVGEEARDGEGGVGVLGKECSVGKLLQ